MAAARAVGELLVRAPHFGRLATSMAGLKVENAGDRLVSLSPIGLGAGAGGTRLGMADVVCGAGLRRRDASTLCHGGTCDRRNDRERAGA